MTDLFGEVPVISRTFNAILLCRLDFSTAVAAIKLPKNIMSVPLIDRNVKTDTFV